MSDFSGLEKLSTEIKFSIKTHHFPDKGFRNKKELSGTNQKFISILKNHKKVTQSSFIIFLTKVKLSQAKSKYQTQQNSIFSGTYNVNK